MATAEQLAWAQALGLPQEYASSPFNIGQTSRYASPTAPGSMWENTVLYNPYGQAFNPQTDNEWYYQDNNGNWYNAAFSPTGGSGGISRPIADIPQSVLGATGGTVFGNIMNQMAARQEAPINAVAPPPAPAAPTGTVRTAIDPTSGIASRLTSPTGVRTMQGGAPAIPGFDVDWNQIAGSGDTSNDRNSNVNILIPNSGAGGSAAPPVNNYPVPPPVRNVPTGSTGTAPRGVTGSTGRGTSTGAGVGSYSGYPVYNYSSGTGYNPTTWQTNRYDANGNPVNPFINSSGQFVYNQVPGMYNYLEELLGGQMAGTTGVSNALMDYLGKTLTSDYPGGMSSYLQQLVGSLGTGQMALGNQGQQAGLQTATGLQTGNVPQTALQSQLTNQLSQLLGGTGLTDEYVQALRDQVLKPSQDEIYGQANRAGAGQIAPSSGLVQELQRRNEKEFNDSLIRAAFENRGQIFNQAMQQGATGFGQGLNLSQLLGNQGNMAIGNALAAGGQGQNLLQTLLSGLLGFQGNVQQNNLTNIGMYQDLARTLLQNKLNEQMVREGGGGGVDWGGTSAAILGMLAAMG